MSIQGSAQLSERASELFENTLVIGAGEYRAWMLGRICQWLDADAAMYRRRHRGKLIHSVTVVGLDRGFPQAWERSADINTPLRRAYETPGKVFSLSTRDNQVEIGAAHFNNRILAAAEIAHLQTVVDHDQRTDLLSEVTVIRRLPKNQFDSEDAVELAQLLPIILGAARHALLLARSEPTAPNFDRPTAIVDEAGRIYDAQHDFFNVLQSKFPHWKGVKLPFELPETPGMHRPKSIPLCIYSEFLGDLTLLRIWPRERLDVLSDREREIAEKVAEGWSHKLVATHFEIAPSTVSNHVTHIYRKLEVRNRAELTRIMGDSGESASPN